MLGGFKAEASKACATVCRVLLGMALGLRHLHSCGSGGSALGTWVSLISPLLSKEMLSQRAAGLLLRWIPASLSSKET